MKNIAGNVSRTTLCLTDFVCVGTHPTTYSEHMLRTWVPSFPAVHLTSSEHFGWLDVGLAGR